MTPSKTEFAGFEVLGPDDPLSSDGWAFLAASPVVADRLAKIGAVLHRHDGHAAMVNPAAVPVVASDPTGGMLRPGSIVYVCYTLTDGDGGETLACAPVSITTPDGFLTPTTAPTVVVDYTAGALVMGTLMYGITVTDGSGGETTIGPGAAITVAPGSPTAQALISGLSAIVAASSGSLSTAGWRLWRRGADGRTYLIGTGTAADDTFTDDGISGNCTVSPPRVSSASGSSTLKVTVPSAGQPAGVTQFAIYGSYDESFTSPSLLGLYAPDQFDVEQVYLDLAPTLATPPPVSRSYPGAHKLNPDSEIDSPWRQKAAYTSDLPLTGNQDGDCRVVLHDHMIYMWWSGDSSWHVYAPGGGGGGGVDGGHADADFGLSISGGAASTDLFVADLDGGTA